MVLFRTAARWTLACVTAAVIATGPAAANNEPAWKHSMAISGTPGYPADFAHFNYVNPDAPKGGLVRLADSRGFDSFNPYSTRGNAAPGVLLIYDALMTPAFDELSISADYPLIAEAVRYPEDYAWVEFRLNADAKFHDGSPITVEDVIWSFEAITDVNPSRAFYYQEVVSAEEVAERTVRFTFERPGNKELPNIMAQLRILPKAWWTGTRDDGTQRTLSDSTLEPPLGSSAYRIGNFEANRFIEYVRVDDYWAADLPSNVGKDNFDTIRYQTFRDQTVALEAFKGDRVDWRTENSAKNWATAYNFPARDRGDVILETFPDEARGIMQAFVLNLRLPKFQDPRVRRALNLIYDFEAQKETIFYGQYERIASYYEGTELAARGLPSEEELVYLEPLRGQIPDQLFTAEYTNPVNGDPNAIRANQREALKLFQEAGYKLEGRTMVNAETGEPFTIEVVENNAAIERVILPYQQSLARLGIELTLKIVDTSQYINRLRARDFEMSVLAFPQSLSPGNEQRDYWGTASAERPDSNNFAGIKNPAIDALIDQLVLAPDRESLVTITKALDRVLLANHYMVPLYYTNVTRTARWDRFGHPENLPIYTPGFPSIWWYDEALASDMEAQQ